MSSYANLPADVLELIVEGLSVVDRLHCEGVNRHWRTAMLSQVWPNTKMEKLDRETVFEGTNAVQREKFNAESLIALVRRVGVRLVELDLASFDGTNDRLIHIDVHFRAMLENCTNLRAVTIGRSPWTEEAFRALAVLPHLNELVLLGDKIDFTDVALREIAKRGQLKKLVIHPDFRQPVAAHPLTNGAIEYLVQHCQQLVTLSISRSRRITGRSLRAIVDEVHRRHGTPPRALPNWTPPLDPGIFYFPCSNPEETMLHAQIEYKEAHGPSADAVPDQLLGLEGETVDEETWNAARESHWLIIYEHEGLLNRKLY